MEENYKIKCPHCGAEYLPAEIFVSDLLGNPRNIIRDEDGKIEHFDGEPMSLTESYCCDYCGCKFAIYGKVDFITDFYMADEDFEEEYTTKVYDNRVSLWEDK